MYIIAIGWLFAALMLAVCQESVTLAVLTLLFWGFIPVALLLWILGSSARRARRRKMEASQASGGDDK